MSLTCVFNLVEILIPLLIKLCQYLKAVEYSFFFLKMAIYYRSQLSSPCFLYYTLAAKYLHVPFVESLLRQLDLSSYTV